MSKNKDTYYIINKITKEILCVRVQKRYDEDNTILEKCFKAPLTRMFREATLKEDKGMAEYYQKEANKLIYPGWEIVNTKEWTP